MKTAAVEQATFDRSLGTKPSAAKQLQTSLPSIEQIERELAGDDPSAKDETS